MKTPEQRGPLGQWLRDQRLKRKYMTAAAAHAALSRARIFINLSDYRSLESGSMRRAPEGFLEAVTAFYGANPPDATDSQGMAELIAALTRQTDAMEALTKRLEFLASQAIRDGVIDALRQAGLFPNAAASQSAPPPSPQP